MSLKPRVAVAWSLKEEQHEQIPGGFLVTQKTIQRFSPKNGWLVAGLGYEQGGNALVVVAVRLVVMKLDNSV